MIERERIHDQLRRAFAGEAWHGPAVQELLRDTTAREAAARPLARAHTIWEIVLHVAVWEDVVRRRLKGERIGELAAAQDWPAVGETSETAWERTLEALERGHHALRQAILEIEESKLEETVPGSNHSVYVMLHGVVQHDLYHAGQIALLKKARHGV
jgi:uncharacterized damage-inducible protein DinB